MIMRLHAGGGQHLGQRHYSRINYIKLIRTPLCNMLSCQARSKVLCLDTTVKGISDLQLTQTGPVALN